MVEAVLALEHGKGWMLIVVARKRTASALFRVFRQPWLLHQLRQWQPPFSLVNFLAQVAILVHATPPPFLILPATSDASCAGSSRVRKLEVENEVLVSS